MKWPTIADTLQTQAPNHPNGYAMISRSPDRLSGAGQDLAAMRCDLGAIARDKAASGVDCGKRAAGRLRLAVVRFWTTKSEAFVVIKASGHIVDETKSSFVSLIEQIVVFQTAVVDDF